MKVKGNKFEIQLEGQRDHWEESGTSDHYYDWTETRYAYRGQGVITNLETGERKVFLFVTSHRDTGRDSLLEDIFLGIDYGYYGFEKKRRPVKQDLLIDYQSAKILRALEAPSSDLPIPTAGIFPVKEEEAEAAGLIPDKNGQEKFDFCAVM